MAKRKQRDVAPPAIGGNGGSFSVQQFTPPKISKSKAAKVIGQARQAAAGRAVDATKSDQKDFLGAVDTQ